MIQRKQTLWLLLAALLNAGVFLADLFQAHTMVNATDVVEHYRTNQHFPLLLIAIAMVAMPLITIFMYKDRKRQVRMSIGSIIIIGAFTTKLLLGAAAKATPPTTVTYWIGAILPLISFIFLILAISGIRKDEKLVRSVDRLR